MRSRILAAARNLITERGYDGVTMRDLADASGVALKTLYYQYTNKENLLRVAIEEKFFSAYEEIDTAKFDHGIDRLFYIIETVGGTSARDEAYAKASAPLLVSRSTVSTLGRVRMNIYRRAIQEIADASDLVSWTDVTLLTALIYRQISAVYLSWSYGQLPIGLVPDLSKLSASLSLATVTTGYSQERARATAEELSVKHRGRIFY